LTSATTSSTSPPSSAEPPAAVAALGRRLDDVRARVAAAGGDAGTIRLVAVTKGFGPAAVATAAAVGLSDIGENYAQELLAKAVSAPPGLCWHFLGRIQRRKVRRLAGLVGVWQSVSRPEEAAEIARFQPGARALAQVDAAGLPGRNGCRPEDVGALVGAMGAAGLDVRGLMTVAPPEPEGARSAFRLVRRLADELGLEECSMGMSDDLEVAVAEGATMLRVGRALFGSRPN
jgi:uncharacterized pyridoxal phosphate-containing UPF0001 family protein